MRILFVSAIDFPDNLDRGARYHIHYWLKALSCDHDVDFLLVESYSQCRVDAPQLTTANVINLSEAPRMALHSRLMRVARSVIFGIPRSAQIAMPQAAVKFVRQAAKDRRYDLAILWAGSAAGYSTILQGAVPIILSRLSVDAADARDNTKRQGMWHPRWAIDEWVIRRYEASTCRAATAISTVNEEDTQDFVRRYRLKNIVRAIPIGVELRQFARREGAAGTKVVCFMGNLDWGANIDALNWFVGQVAPQVMAVDPQARFRVIGPGGSNLREKLAGPAVEFTGYVRSVPEATADVAVGVVPVFSGTGMRIKLLEFLSMGIPTVTTSLGTAGLRCVDGKHVLIADGTESFAAAVNKLLSDPVLRAKLSKNGPELASQYAWDGIVPKVRELVRDTVIAFAKRVQSVPAEGESSARRTC
jgi:glycosyltransferase involved in cell wall biosynthesis